MGSSLLLGEILVKRGQIRRYQLEFALKLQEIYRGLRIHHSIGELLVDHRGLGSKSLNEALLYQEAQIEQSKKQHATLDAIEDEETETKIFV